MNKRAFPAACAMMLSFLSTLLFSESGSEQYKTIDHLIIHGLNRTKPVVVEQLLEPYIGIPADALEPGEVQTVLRESGLFYETKVTVEIDDSESAALVVSVREKWTLIPIPLLLGDKNGIAGGATLIETNAFGLNHHAFLAAFFSGDGYTLFTSYATPPGRDFPFGLSAGAAVSNGETTVTDGEEKELLAWEAKSINLFTGLQYNLTPRVTLSAGFGYREASVEKGNLPSARMLPLSAEIRIQKSDWNGLFLSRRGVEIRSSWSVPLEGDPYLALQGECVWQRAPVRRLRLMLGASAFQAEEAPLVFSEGPSAAGVAILPGDFRSNSLAGTSWGIEGVLADFGTGMLSTFFSYQAALAEDITGSHVFAQGPHFGLRCYLKKIAFPALDLGAAYNAESSIWNAAFSVGMKM